MLRGVTRGIRPLAIGAVVAIVWGYFAAQYPYLLPQSLTIEDAVGAAATQTEVIIVFIAAAVVCLPSLGLLYVLAHRRALE